MENVAYSIDAELNYASIDRGTFANIIFPAELWIFEKSCFSKKSWKKK